MERLAAWTYPLFARADGVTVAKSIVLENKFENLGARCVRPHCRVANLVGD